jgi:single-strand DNA-binding protein
MSWDINRCVLVGRLSNDPELKYTPSNTAVAHFGLAVGGKPKPDGKPSVSFFNVVVWAKIAENTANYLHKGSQVVIEGRLDQRSWKAQDGSNRSVVEIIADRVEFIGGRPAEGTRSSGGQPAQKPEPATSYEDNFYDSTDFNTEPVDPNQDLPNF